MSGSSLESGESMTSSLPSVADDIEEQKDLIRLYLQGDAHHLRQLLMAGYGSSNLDALVRLIMDYRQDRKPVADFIMTYASGNPRSITDPLVRLQVMMEDLLKLGQLNPSSHYRIKDSDGKGLTLKQLEGIRYLLDNIFPIRVSDAERIVEIDRILETLFGSRLYSIVQQGIVDKLLRLASQSAEAKAELTSIVENYYERKLCSDDRDYLDPTHGVIEAIEPFVSSTKLDRLKLEQRLHLLYNDIDTLEREGKYQPSVDEMVRLIGAGAGRCLKPRDPNRVVGLLSGDRANQIVELGKSAVRRSVVDHRGGYTQLDVDQLLSLLINPTDRDQSDVSTIIARLRAGPKFVDPLQQVELICRERAAGPYPCPPLT